MQELAAKVANHVRDYHNYCGFQFTSELILKWVEQFEEEDREFILKEFLHLLQNGIYISEADARGFLWESIEKLASHFGITSVSKFLDNVLILQTQPEGKSQDILLKLLDEELVSRGYPGIEFCGKSSHKYVLYYDDVLATGGTVFRDLLTWLQDTGRGGQRNLDSVIEGSQIVIANYFCVHTWGQDNFSWRLKQALNEDKILNKIQIFARYKIENHVKKFNQRYNFAYPTTQSDRAKEYLESLSATYNEQYAFRKPHLPGEEKFYSSAQNRIRFENILLIKGIDLLTKAKQLQKNHRPLGVTLPLNRLFGTGTIFFTWRNVSNTCPVVFWWKSSYWEPLFPLYRRGLKGAQQ